MNICFDINSPESLLKNKQLVDEPRRIVQPDACPPHPPPPNTGEGWHNKTRCQVEKRATSLSVHKTTGSGAAIFVPPSLPPFLVCKMKINVHTLLLLLHTHIHTLSKISKSFFPVPVEERRMEFFSLAKQIQDSLQ